MAVHDLLTDPVFLVEGTTVYSFDGSGLPRFDFDQTEAGPDTFRLFSDASFKGVDNLDPELTINGVTKTPMFRYKGGDATTTTFPAWGYGEDLVTQGSGDFPTPNQGSPLLGSNDDSVIGAGTTNKSYTGTDGSFGDVGTEDIVVEAVLKMNNSALNNHIFTKQLQASPQEGYIFNINNRSITLSLDDGPASIPVIAATVIEGAWYHVMCFVNRNEGSTSGSQWYVNGIASGTGVDMSSVSDTLSNDNNLHIFANRATSNSYDSNLAYLAAWKQSDWHQAGASGPAEWAVIAKERFQKLTGIYPDAAAGTATPTVTTRATPAYIDKLEGGTAQVLVDGDMENAGVGDWNAISSAVLTKETTDPHRGSQVLRVAYGGETNPFASQSIMTAGKRTRATGYARSDGTALPRFSDSGLQTWNGTTSTTWQYFDVTFIAFSSSLRLYAITTGAGYVEWDDVTIEELPVSKLYRIGDNWLRLSSRLDKAGNTLKGYLPEIAAENKCLQSETLSIDGTTTVAPWEEESAGCDFEVNGAVAPNGETTADGIIAPVGNAEHGVHQDIIVTAVNWTVSAFVKAGDNDWFQLHNLTITNGAVWFGIGGVAAGTVGTQQADVIDARIETWGDGWFRCSFTFLGTAAAHTIEFHSEEADNDDRFSGDGSTVNIYLWGAQAETGRVMSSYIPTVASAVTRNKDELTYKGDDGNIGGVGSELKGTIALDILFEDYDSVLDRRPISLSDGGSGANAIIMYTTSLDKIRISSVATGGNSGSVTSDTDITDGVIHSVRMTWITDSMKLYIDGSREGTEDTSVDPPDDLDQIDIGMSSSNIFQFGGLLANLSIKNYIETAGDFIPVYGASREFGVMESFTRKMMNSFEYAVGGTPGTFTFDGDGAPRWSEDLFESEFSLGLGIFRKLQWTGSVLPAPPVITFTVTIIDSVTIRLTFNLPVVNNPALSNAGNYVVTPTLAVSTIVPEGVGEPRYVDVTVNEMKTGEAYTITVYNTLELA